MEKQKDEPQKKEVTGELDDKKKKDALVTCRILFISVLDKIYIAFLLLFLVLGTVRNFGGDLSSVSYGFWGRVLSELILVVVTIITYFLCNWFYKCYAKTMLCVTEKEIYKEKYLPFKRSETTIPLNRITSITAYKFLWIFRSVIICQYHRFPVVFFTWNNQEFKDKVEELLVEDATKVNNQFESKNIINKRQYKYVGILGIVLVAIIALIGIVRFFCYTFSEERKIPGSYSYNKYSIKLDEDGSCDLNINSSDITSCNWTYNSDTKKVEIEYNYKYSSYYSYYVSEYSDSVILKYDNDTLSYKDMDFKRD